MARVPECPAISAMVARDSALIGLKAALPSSLIQMSCRMSSSTGHFRPPATMASLKSRHRCETGPAGSPMEKRVPSRWRTWPGPSSSVEQ